MIGDDDGDSDGNSVFCRLLFNTIFISTITLLIGDDTPNKTMLWLKSLLVRFKKCRHAPSSQDR